MQMGWMGLATLLGVGLLILDSLRGLLFPISYILSPAILSSLYLPLLILGVVGFYAWHGGEAGRFGLVGMILVILGMSLTWIEILLGALLGFSYGPFDITFPTIAVGFVVFGLGTWRARRMSRWNRSLPLTVGSLMLIGYRAVIVGRPAGWLPVLLVLSWIPGFVVMGYLLWSRRHDKSMFSPE